MTTMFGLVVTVPPSGSMWSMRRGGACLRPSAGTGSARLRRLGRAALGRGRVVAVRGDRLDLPGLRRPPVGPFPGREVEPDRFALLIGALVPLGVVLMGGVDIRARALTGLGTDHLQAEVVVEAVHTVHDGVAHHDLRVLLAQGERVG